MRNKEDPAPPPSPAVSPGSSVFRGEQVSAVQGFSAVLWGCAVCLVGRSAAAPASTL